MTEPRVLLDDIVMGESTRWHDGRVWFCDWGAGDVIVLDEAGKPDVVARVQGMPFCIDWLPDGRLLVIAGPQRRLLRQEPDGSLVTHADLTGLAGPYAYNDIAADGRGNAYVNNIGFDFPGGEPAPGVIVVATPDGSARPVADGVMFPNGMAVTPDDATLIVAESYASRLTAFDIEPDGGLTNRRVWAELDHAAPDGICIDAEGAVWYADVPNQHCVRVAEGGQVRQTVGLDRGAFACALSSGTAQPTLYINAADYTAVMSGARTGRLLAVDVTVPGVARR
ncbi:MAG TPA: SMP-30/gluconolactonase/LRE family protein [Actinoplanes sp.]|nr:SMP-30/gluconolactonase/LRE family protein [Actinoplanes sp.]